MTFSASGGPRGYRVDHESPEKFVVRCAHCGRLALEDGRAEAHSRADNHALRCANTGVTPVSVRSDAREDVLVPETAETVVPIVTEHNVDIFETDLSDESITVRYESVSRRSGEKEIHGEVTAMVPGREDDPVEYRGVILRLPSQKRRRVDFLDKLVECPHNSARGWRRIGDLLSVGPAMTAGSPPVVMTDGGTDLSVSDTERWIEAGGPEPMAADKAESGGCEFDCDAPADYVVQFDDGRTVACCGVCSVSNRLYVEENDLLKADRDRGDRDV